MFSENSHSKDTGELAQISKAKRVRTGCLTCRERHLKCDENLPDCNNCRKSSRACKRGLRLNFIDSTVKDLPRLPKTEYMNVYFQDESRDIASEYRGGLDKYERSLPDARNLSYSLNFSAIAQPLILNSGMMMDDNFANTLKNNQVFHQEALHVKQTGNQAGNANMNPESQSKVNSYISAQDSSHGSIPKFAPMIFGGQRTVCLRSSEEVLLMQVFVEEVGKWMDSMDPMKHFSRRLPFQALEEPMLLNAILACGARHLTLVNPNYHEDKALFYQNTSTTLLLRTLRKRDRDLICCAATAVILNVYEMMSEKSIQRTNHTAGARALIKECGWSAKSTGIGAACFWLNVGMELLSCLHSNKQVAWQPDLWGVDMDFKKESECGKEEVWVHRILYIVSKISDLRASIPQLQAISLHDEPFHMQNRLKEWQKLRRLCEGWNQNIPQTMRPIGYLHPSQNNFLSAFPKIWLIKRATIVGRLFYHTAMILLAQIYPSNFRETGELQRIQLNHAHMICGIAAHVNDRGVANVTLRTLAIAAECLVARREQEEILEIIERVQQETGWRVDFILKELRSRWGWDMEETQISSAGPSEFVNNGCQIPSQVPGIPVPPHASDVPSGLVAEADFSLPNQPYQGYYQPPEQQITQSHT